MFDFESKFKEIQELSGFIKQEIQDALMFDVGKNPFLKLNHLEQIEIKLGDLNNKLNLEELDPEAFNQALGRNYQINFGNGKGLHLDPSDNNILVLDYAKLDLTEVNKDGNVVSIEAVSGDNGKNGFKIIYKDG